MAYTSTTYPQIFADALKWTDEQGEEFHDQFDQILGLAETEVLRDLNLEGFRASMAGSLAIGNHTLAYPSGCVKTDAIFLLDSGNNLFPVFYRSVQWCRNYAQNISASGPPKYYAEVDGGYFFAPGADQTYPVTIYGINRPASLSETNLTTWLSTNVPELLLLSTLLHSEQFLIAAAPVSKWKGEYMEAMGKARREFAGLTHKEFSAGFAP